MHIQIFFDTCILFAYLNPTELFHNDATETIAVIDNPSKFLIKGKVKDFRGYILDIVENEFFDILHYKMNQVLQDVHDFFKKASKFSEEELTRRLNLIKRQNVSLANLIEYLLNNYDLSSTSSLRNFLELFNKLRMVFRKKYFQLTSLRNIKFKKSPDYLRPLLDQRARNIIASYLDLTDKKILVYADHMALRNNPAHLITIDFAMINQRMLIMPQLPNDLNIISLIEFGKIYLGKTEHIALFERGKI